MLSFPSRTDLQVIVVDDCSVSSSAWREFAIEFSDFDFFRLDVNSGAGVARNCGLKNAVGEYILFADADDEFLPLAFDIFDLKLKSTDEVSYFLAEAKQDVSGLPSVRADGFNKLCFDYLNDKSNDNLLSLKIGHCSPCAKVYKKSFLDETNIKFDATFVANDVYFNVINALMAKKVSVYDDYVYRIYRLSDSLTSTTTASRLIQRVQVLAKVADKAYSLGVRRKFYGSALLLESLTLGFGAFLSVFFEITKSRLSFGVSRILNPKRWRKYFNYRVNLHNEKKK